MDVRYMKGDPSMWERLAWEELSTKEKELWTLLGWQADTWNRNEAPPSTSKFWKDLNFQEQKAAVSLGFTEDVWDNFEDQ